MVTTKERCPMAMSISAVAAICAPAPSITQGQKLKDGRGSGTPVTSKTPIRDSNAKGKPNRERTWVAPTVPRLVVSSRCIALRKVWKNAAVTVKTIQSQEEIIPCPPFHHGRTRRRSRAAQCETATRLLFSLSPEGRGIGG